MPSSITPRPQARTAATWRPREHGAWSWLASPVVAGSIVAGPHLHQLFVLGVALSGYLFFNAASLWAKMPPLRRGQATAPMLVYAIVTALLGVGLLLTGGWGAATWLALLMMPLAVAYLFTLRGAGRSLASGLLTALSASMLVLVTVHPDLPSLFLDFRTEWGWAFLIVLGHTTCTLYAVKSQIRERTSNRFLAASIGWHVAWALVTAVGSLYGLPAVWPLFFLLETARASALPLYVRHHSLRPLTIGLIELGLTLLMLALLAWRGV